ncbi:MAG: hypothetical protein AABX08_04430 [Nanoarchaeota archaeon]
MKIFILILAMTLIFAAFAMAAPVIYGITVNGFADGVAFTKTQNEVKECENTCEFPVAQFEVPERFTFTNYVIANPSELIKSIKFKSTNELTSSSFEDIIVLETLELKEELKIGRLVTKNLNQGQNNLVIQLENIGLKDINDISVQISGDGVKTTSRSMISLAKEQTDFINTIVQITNYGDIDIIIKAYSNEKLLGQAIETIYVEPPEELPTEEVVYVDDDYAQAEVNKLWDKLSSYEKEYFTKESQDYKLSDLESDLDNIKNDIKELELNYGKLTKEGFDREVSIILRSLDDVKLQIDLAAPKKFTDSIKEHLVLIATSLGIIVSSLTAFGLAKSHVLSKNKEEKKVHKAAKK